MCVGIPMQVVTIDGMYAWCEGRDGSKRINTMLLGEVQPGDWLLTFLDSAREIIDAERAALINSALDALALVASGQDDIDACFADLVGREPQLPDFLRTDLQRKE